MMEDWSDQTIIVFIEEQEATILTVILRKDKFMKV